MARGARARVSQLWFIVAAAARAVKTSEGRDEGGNSVRAWHTWFSSLWAACGDQILTVGRRKYYRESNYKTC